MTERMAVEITVYLDVPEGITEEGMDLAAEGVVQAVGVDFDAALNGPPCLVDYVGGAR
jgi:hypothetical protein